MGEIFKMIRTKAYDWVPQGEAILVNKGETIMFHLGDKKGYAEIKKPTGVKIVNLKPTPQFKAPIRPNTPKE